MVGLKLIFLTGSAWFEINFSHKQKASMTF